MRKYADPRLLPAAELVKRGEAAHAETPGAWGQLVDATQRRGGGDPLHHLRHHGAAEARHADRRAR